MVNSEAVGENESVLGQIERLTSGSGSIVLRLGDHPYYGAMATSPSNTLTGHETVGRRFWSVGPRGENGILEYVDIIKLSHMGLQVVRVLDANAPPISIELAFASNEPVSPHPDKFISMTIYMDFLGNILATLPVQNKPNIGSELTELFYARLQDWGIETVLTPNDTGDDVHLNVRWVDRVAASLSVLA